MGIAKYLQSLKDNLFFAYWNVVFVIVAVEKVSKQFWYFDFDLSTKVSLCSRDCDLVLPTIILKRHALLSYDVITYCYLNETIPVDYFKNDHSYTIFFL